MTNVVFTFRNREIGADTYRRNTFRCLRTLICKGNREFTKVWTRSSNKAWQYESGRILSDNYKVCHFGYGRDNIPRQMYKLPKTDTGKTEDALIYRCFHEHSDNFTEFENRPCLVTLQSARKGESICFYDLDTGQLLKDIFLSQLTGNLMTSSIVMAVFDAFPLTFVGMFEVDKRTVLNLPTLKFAEVHSVRWLSLEAAVRAIYRTYPTLVMCLEADATTEPTVKGLLHEVSQFRFIALTHLLMDSLDFGTVNTEVSSTCESLEDLIECDGAFTDKLAGFVKEVDGKTFYDRPVCESESGNVLDTIQCNVIFDGFDPVEEPEEEPEEILEGQDEAGFKPELRQQKGLLGRLGPQYISRVVENVRDRFQDIPIVDSMSVLVPSNIASSVSIAKYGLVQFKCLVEHFKPFIGSPEMCLSEYSEYKRLVAKAYTTLGLLDITQVCMCKFASKLLNIVIILKCCAVVPMSSVQCERGFSTQNRIMTRLRTSLNNKNLDTLMRIREDGPPLNQFDFNRALLKWKRL
ncbi:DCA17-like protein [Mya arenaria]|uniref:DCA17-like protein n=1 Tax=Mya arenaria TaxID=6604 RepID=A0ABY7F397_MYAAR|nr:DCA17-like protein [Mya arenaria]